MKAAWKMDSIYKADASKVAEELESLGNEYSLADIVEKAKDEKSEMHSCFEWDDSIAGQKYREHQAGKMVRMLVFTKEEKGEEQKTNIRLIVSTGKHNNTYTPTKLIVRKEDEYQALLDRALAELRAFKAKYSALAELEEIFALID